MKNNREEFEENLHESIRGIKQLTDGLKVQIRNQRTLRDRIAVGVTRDKI
jgi:hypothetical protein